MRALSVILGLVLTLSCVSLLAEEAKKDETKKPEKVSVTGTLHRAMAIGGETTGWSIQLDQETTIGGKAVQSVEVAYSKAEKLEKLVDQRVKAKGTMVSRHGVETGDRTVLEIQSIKKIKAK